MVWWTTCMDSWSLGKEAQRSLGYRTLGEKVSRLGVCERTLASVTAGPAGFCRFPKKGLRLLFVFHFPLLRNSYIGDSFITLVFWRDIVHSDLEIIPPELHSLFQNLMVNYGEAWLTIFFVKHSPAKDRETCLTCKLRIYGKAMI